MLVVAVLSVPVADGELAADRMWVAGAQAVEERSVGDRVEVLSVLGDRAQAAARLGALQEGWTLRFDEVDPTPAETWREFAEPIVVEPDVVLRPAWRTPSPGGTATDDSTPTRRIEVSIEPAGSFGLGDHPTTRLCAAAVRRLTSGGEAVLDVGCGSGVLGILAVMCGAAEVTAIDIADLAVTATIDNATRNGVADRVSASTSALDEIDGAFDLVVANILAPTLRAMADGLRERVAASGYLVVSGILDGGYESVVDALRPLVVDRIDRLDGWVAITLRHPDASSASISAR